MKVGSEAEDRAAAALEAAGYSIGERNWRCDAGELDVVAREGHVLAFVEEPKPAACATEMKSNP